jgi:hypothetical protein
MLKCATQMTAFTTIVVITAIVGAGLSLAVEKPKNDAKT